MSEDWIETLEWEVERLRVLKRRLVKMGNEEELPTDEAADAVQQALDAIQDLLT